MTTLPTSRTTASSKAEHLADHLALAALANAHGDPTVGEPWFDVRARGALGNNTGDDSIVINAAIVAARAAYDATPSSGTRTVYFPAGTYRCLSSIIQRYGVRFAGPGVLTFPNDLGAGTFALDFAVAGGDGYHNVPKISGLRIYGPVTNFVVGVQGCNMDGIRLAGGESLTDVYVQRFRAGLDLGENHNTLIDVTSIQNYYNVHHPTPHGTADNHQHFGCYYHQAAKASVAVGPDNVMSQTLMVGCQLGFSPYGLYKYGSGATGGLATSSTFIDVSFEGCGNGFIYDSRADGTNDSLVLCTFTRCLGLASSGATTYRIAADLPLVAGINVRGLVGCRFEEAHSPLTAVIPGGARQINVRSICADNTIIGGSISSTAGEFANLASLGAIRMQSNESNSRPFVAESHYAWATIAPGDLCAWSSNGNGVVRYGGATGGAFAGVAMNNAVLSGVVMLAQVGSIVNINCVSGTAGSDIRPDATTPHNGSSSGSTPIVAAGVGALVGGKLPCKVRA